MLHATPAAPQAWRLGLLIGGNLLASIGGGRVLSAGKGVTGLTVLGSGSILAFLAGSALGLGLLTLMRRYHLGRALAGVSITSILSSLTLIAILWSDAVTRADAAESAVWNDRRSTLSGPVAWLFFLFLVVRCALWFASRSMRSDVAASIRLSWLALTEWAYFFGFIVGLLLGPVYIGAHGPVVGALLLDTLLLSVVAGCDLFQRRSVVSGRRRADQQDHRESLAPARTSFWRLTAAFGAATIACQVVIFHFADVVALSRPAVSSLAEATLASFYVGVSCAAAFCSWSRPVLKRLSHQAPLLELGSARRVLRVPVALLIAMSGILILSGLYGIVSITSPGRTGLLGSAGGTLSLVALGTGSGFFELFVLAVVGRISSGEKGAVALAFGLVASVAALGLFLMMLGGIRFPGWAMVTVVGLALATTLVSGTGEANRPDGGL